MGWLSSRKENKGPGAKGLSAVSPLPVKEDRAPLAASPSKKDEAREIRLYQVKKRIHHLLLERLDLSALEELEEKIRAREIRQALATLLEEEEEPLNLAEKTRLNRELEFEILGLGPLEPLLSDSTISDILVNRHNQVYIKRRGLLEFTDVRFQNDEHLLKIINKIVSNVGRRIDESAPMVDARLPDGSRVNAIIPPLALDGPMLCIRRFNVMRPTLEDLIEKGTFTAEIGEVLKAVAVAKLSVLISGGTGAGKTTLLNILSGFIPANERIITVEDSAELQLQQEHVCRLETRPSNVEGKGEITSRDLVRNSLRMRPDRIVVGEVRGSEVIDMLQAMNTGHEGSMTTVHANTARDALLRLETMISLSGITIQESGYAPDGLFLHQCGPPVGAPQRWPPPPGILLGNHRDGGRGDQHAGYLHLRTPRHDPGWDDYGAVCGHRSASPLRRTLQALRGASHGGHLQSTQSGPGLKT